MLGAFAAGCTRPATRPNILFISIDTLRADHCSLYGYERQTTPRLAGVARDGVAFERAYAPMATTAPSHATMFTGLLPRRHGVVKNGLILGQSRDALAQILSRNGYETSAVVSSFVVNRRFGFAQGFGSYDDEFPKRGSTARNNTFEDMEVPGGFDQRANRATDKAIRWLEGRGYLEGARPARPFFLWTHYFDPHDPYDPPRIHRREFGKQRGRRANMLADYDAEVRFTDAEVGRLLDALATARTLDDTLVVITADHGEGLMSHGHRNHGIHLYEEAVRVPLVMRWPRSLPRGLWVAPPVTLADLLPTILELSGIQERPARTDGVSLAAVARGRRAADAYRAVFLQRRDYDSGEEVSGLAISGEKTGLRLGQYKYIEGREENSFEFFDLDADPDEARNLYGQREKETAALQQVLNQWRTKPGARRAEGDQTDETREALRALGYVQ